MAQINFNVGAIANDGTGEPLRQAFQEQQAMNTELYATKVDKVVGKQLSDNNYTDVEVIKLDGIEEGAEVNVQADWNQSDDTQDDYIKNKPTELFSSVGYFHYADLATQTSPLSILSGVNTRLNNDGEGAQTNTDQAPYGVSSVYNVLANKFDFSQLSIGDTLNLRVDLSLTTTSANQKYLVFLRVGEGSDAQYDLPITNGHIKAASSDNRIVGNEPFSIDYQQHIDNLAVLFIISDDNATVKVNGFFINVVRKSVNIVDIVGGGAVDSVNGQTGVVVLDAEDVGAIPISGTTAGNPITGDLEVALESKLIFKDLDNNPFIKIGYNPVTDETGIWYDNGVDLPVRFSILSNSVSFFIKNNSIAFSENEGIIGSTDFTPNITDLDYTQKKYVDTKAPLNPRVQSVTSSATVAPTSTNDIVTITAQAVALTLANPTGTFAEGQALMIRIKDNGTARAITFGSNYRAIGVTLPTTTIANKILYLGIIYDSIDAKWNILGINLQA